ncbi:hypothetical protein HF086_006752 [Spodoptera exigua]|uniref:Uncharacterized protein n=1 Tax=Spodoptera exigua TaxID=7107 RepID=A0A922SBF1_SPOEX|nr:hypothetical protein HF086_006752 [Spodoptera exigua]
MDLQQMLGHQRAPALTFGERNLLRRIIKDFPIVKCRINNANLIPIKNAAWKSITRKFNYLSCTDFKPASPMYQHGNLFGDQSDELFYDNQNDLLASFGYSGVSSGEVSNPPLVVSRPRPRTRRDVALNISLYRMRKEIQKLKETVNDILMQSETQRMENALAFIKQQMPKSD